MNTKKELLIYAAAFVAMTAIAPLAFADTISQNQNGAGNTQIIGNGNNSPGSNSPHLTATGGTGIGVSSSSSKASAHQSQVAVAAGGSSKASADNKGNSLAVNQNYKRNPVSSAISAPLVAADDTCMGSSSVGGQGVGFGLSVGSTWKDGDCVRRKDARELHNMGEKKAAIALMCQNEAVAAAMKAAGRDCPVTESSLAPAAGTSTDSSDSRWPSTRSR